MSNFEERNVYSKTMRRFDKYERLIWKESVFSDLPTTPELDDAWIRLEQRIDISDREVHINQNQIKVLPIFRWRPRLSYAISMMLFVTLVCSSILYQLFATETVFTGPGMFETVLLSDGSSVTLNSGSKITYKTNFNNKNRDVRLKGEAFFKVQPGRFPFLIHTDHGKVEVLGTSFNILARPENFEVGVNTGVVQVSNKTKSVILKQGERINFKPSESHLGPVIKSYANYPDWIYNKMVFEKTPLRTVCNEIERIFDISFIFSKPSFANITITGVLDATDLNSVLSTISLLTQQEFKFDGETCTIF